MIAFVVECRFVFSTIFFTGHVDPGEDEAQTALREVEEESGYKKDDLILHDFEQAQQVLLLRR